MRAAMTFATPSCAAVAGSAALLLYFHDRFWRRGVVVSVVGNVAHEQVVAGFDRPLGILRLGNRHVPDPPPSPRPGVFLNSPSDATVLPLVLDAARQPVVAPSDDEMARDAATFGVEPLFVRGVSDSI